ncbi:DUF1697 domain-containing protein [Lysinibacillus macroides]|uniref:Cytoplasmic protein n=1 Tax=Lysinibacillus macroides TaxID=33935 RepID=A0A0M9DMK6_9BACI|nr:DUF1697 domain-containing protein [Lysinibacillus macroides]KOY83450.1 cytoplasmic protein [Lysinibacillus macroides]QPR69321.1 DUF1697 domain-containing protein [Lysinibacillus macroides]
MTKYIALLRGINVGGHNQIKMAALREALQILALQNIQTYIQSGNILFDSGESEAVLQQQIQAILQETFAITSTVILRTAEEFQAIMKQCPFSEQDIAEASATAVGECLHVAFLPAIPTKANAEKLLSYANDKERCVIEGRNIYLLFYHSIRNAKLGQQLPQLELPATVRNWKTITKLTKMIDE